VRIPIDPTSVPLARHVLRSLNFPPPVDPYLPIIHGQQYINLFALGSMEQANVLVALKTIGVLFVSPIELPPSVSTQPILTLLTPNSAPHGTSPALQVQGTGFVSGSIINFRNSPYPTTWVNATTLTCTLSKGGLTPKGTYSVVVKTPDGQTSNALTFTAT